MKMAVFPNFIRVSKREPVSVIQPKVTITYRTKLVKVSFFRDKIEVRL